MEKTNVKKWLPWQTFCYLVAAPNTRNKCRNSWKASRRWRRIGQGSLPWGIRFWACLDVVSRLGVQGRLKNRVGGPGPRWNGSGGRLRPEKRGRPGNSKNATLPARESFFGIFWHFLCIFWAFFCIFFCISQTRSYFFAIFLHFPDSKSFFGIFLHFPKPGVIFCNCLHFLDRVCHLHRLPDPYEKTTRKWTMLESRKRQENDKKMIRKWQKKMT